MTKFFDLWYKTAWGDGRNWLGAESDFARVAYHEGMRIAESAEFATLSTVISQLEAGDVPGSLKMLRARLQRLEAHADFTESPGGQINSG